MKLKKKIRVKFYKLTKRQRIAVGVGVLLLVLVVALLVFIHRSSRKTDSISDQPSPTPVVDTVSPTPVKFQGAIMSPANRRVLSLRELNASGQTGFVQYDKVQDNQTRITIILTNAFPKRKQPILVKSGNCAKPGETLNELNAAVKGVSVNVVQKSLEEIFSSDQPKVIVTAYSIEQKDKLITCAEVREKVDTGKITPISTPRLIPPLERETTPTLTSPITQKPGP